MLQFLEEHKNWHLDFSHGNNCLGNKGQVQIFKKIYIVYKKGEQMTI